MTCILLRIRCFLSIDGCPFCFCVHDDFRNTPIDCFVNCVATARHQTTHIQADLKDLEKEVGGIKNVIFDSLCFLSGSIALLIVSLKKGYSELEFAKREVSSNI